MCNLCAQLALQLLIPIFRCVFNNSGFSRLQQRRRVATLSCMRMTVPPWVCRGTLDVLIHTTASAVWNMDKLLPLVASAAAGGRTCTRISRTSCTATSARQPLLSEAGCVCRLFGPVHTCPAYRYLMRKPLPL